MEKILQGKVVSGQKLARKFGVETANLEIFRGILDEQGVYIVECFLDNEKNPLPAVMHYGKRKTTDGKFSVEVHLLDFSRDLYGKTLKIKVLKKLREIQKFDSVENLFQQIKKDIIQTRKFFLRRQIKETWRKLDQKSREILAEKALQQVSQLPEFLSAQNVYIYAPKGDEIDFVEKLCEKFPEKKYYFPKIIDGEMEFFSPFATASEDRRDIFSKLKVGKWGIREPEEQNPLTPLSGGKEIADLVFVPAVGADFAGNRLGNGGGFYDRFLAENHAKTICVLPEFAVFREIPVEEWDVKVGEVLVV